MKASIKSSYLWTFVQTIHLTTNMRVKLYGDFDAGSFAQLLLKLGNGEIPNTNDVISIPDDCGTIVSSTEELEAHVYPNLATNYKNIQWLCERASATDAIPPVTSKLVIIFPTSEG